jgi:hypothetical protein
MPDSNAGVRFIDTVLGRTQIPKILFLGRWDWANLCNRIARAINTTVGVECARVATENAHPFGYLEDLILKRDGARDAVEIAKTVDWIITTGDGEYDFFQRMLSELPLPQDVSIAVTHAGSAYRENARRMNRRDAELGAKVRFVGSDSLKLARGDSRAVPYFGTSDLAPKLTRVDGIPIVSHSPSSRATKGSEKILTVLTRLEAEGLYSVDLIEGVSAEEANRRRRRAHIHIDQMNPDVGGFGQSAIEAMGVGCAVLCDIRNVVPDVWRFFPPPPIIDVRKSADLEQWLRSLAANPELLHRYRAAAYAWSDTNSAPDAVARYWLYHLDRAS